MSKPLIQVLFGLGLAGMVSACSNTTPSIGGNVRYGDAKDVETLTNEFSSTDLQTIAETMARSLGQFARGYESKPLVTIAPVKNKTSEYIDTRAITDSIRTQLIKSGTMRFATNTNEMQNQIDEVERQNSSGYYNQSSVSRKGQMLGARFRIEGAISSIVKQTADVKDVYYNINLIMTDIQSGTIEWTDDKEIRKTSQR